MRGMVKYANTMFLDTKGNTLHMCMHLDTFLYTFVLVSFNTTAKSTATH